MGAFNTLITEISCPDCGKTHDARIQFKFGHTWQLEYQVGDTITWGGNDNGSPVFNKVKVYGIIESETCPYCNKSNIADEYDIFVTENVIMNVSTMESINDYLMNNEDYVILK